MTAYPVTVKKQSGRARSDAGGKDYHLVLISNADGNTITIFRWGKKDSWGIGFQVDRHADEREGRKAYERKFSEKLGKEYVDHFLNKEVLCGDETQFKAALGPYFYKMSPADLTWLAPGIDTTGAREQKTVAWDERPDGSHQLVQQRKLIEEAPEPVVDRVKENPAWGTW